MENNWMEQLESRIDASHTVQVSIDGQIWTIDQEQGGSSFSLTNQFGNKQTFETAEQLITSLQSRFENPTIVVL